MGGKSSKEKRIGISKEKKPKKRAEVVKESNQETEHRQLFVIEHYVTEKDSLDAVMDTLGANIDILPMTEIEFYINTRFHVDLNAADQKKFIQNVITNEF